jgi:hypothetical protein
MAKAMLPPIKITANKATEKDINLNFMDVRLLKTRPLFLNYIINIELKSIAGVEGGRGAS